MEEDSCSWIRREKLSYTLCGRLESFPASNFSKRNPGLKSRLKEASSYLKSKPNFTDIHKLRSTSPIPETILPDTFKEAQSEKKRSSTPYPRKERDNRIARKFFKSNSNLSLTIFKSFLPINKPKSKKESSWSKYFDQSGRRVMAIDEVNEWMIDLSKLFIGLKFAHGTHSQLYHGNYKDEPVAVKIIRAPDNDDDESGALGIQLEAEFNRELILLSRLRHQNILKFVAASRDPPVFCIVTEYLSEGSLRAYLHKLEHKPLPLEQLVLIGLDIARGLEYIHSEGFIHRDLKPENVIISEDFHMKVADFGSACEEIYCDALSDDPGTFRWMAPEMIKHKPYGRKVDVYSFGLILWEMMAGNIPYGNMTPIQAAFAVVNKDLRPVIPKNCPSAMGALVEQCWSLQPEKRPEFWQVVKVLEQFEFLLSNGGTLNMVLPILAFQDPKKGLHRIQKLNPPNT